MNRSNTSPETINDETIAAGAFDYKGWREKFITVTLRLACLLGILMIAGSFTTATPRDRALFIVLYLLLVALTFLRTPYWLRAGVLTFASFIIGLNAMLAWGVWLDATLFFLASVLLAGLLFDEPVDIGLFALSITAIASIAVFSSNGLYKLTAPLAPKITPLGWLNIGFDYVVLAAIVISSVNMFKREFSRVVGQMRLTFDELIKERSQLEEHVRERTRDLERTTTQLRSSATIARLSSQSQDVMELMQAVVSLSSERFNLHHVGLFLLDDYKRIAYIGAASSQKGKELIEQGYRVTLDKRNVFSAVVEQKRYQILQSGSQSLTGTDDNFPTTRSRLILPLLARGNLIGMLDLHSEQKQAFGPDDAEIMESLADLVAIAIENVRLLNSTRALVDQLEVLSQHQSQGAWEKYSERRTPAYQYTPAGVRPLSPNAVRRDLSSLQIPLQLRGIQIGVISLRRKNIANWTEDERALVEKIAAQVSLALDNSRLVEEAQRGAQRDQLIASVSSRVRETLDVDTVIKTAASELRRIFDLKEAEVSIGLLHEEPLSTPPGAKPAHRLKSN